MRYEVEQKYRLDDQAAAESRLAELNVVWRPPQRHVDTYFAHPSRDFAATDEALRIRQVNDDALITYKGPKVGVIAKTRKELELPLCGGGEGAGQFTLLLESLGFRRVADVVKSRRSGMLVWQGVSVEAALDDVDEVGHFLEIELISDDAGLAAAEQLLQSLAQRLGVTNQEKRSYLGLLLARRQNN